MPNIPYAGTEILDADDVSYAEIVEPVIRKRHCTFCGFSLAKHNQDNGGETCFRHGLGSLPKTHCAVCGHRLAEHDEADMACCREMEVLFRRPSARHRTGKASDGKNSPPKKAKLSPQEIAAYSDDILEAVHRVYHIRVTDLWGTMLTGLRLEARQVAVYLLCARPALSRRVIGGLVHIDETSTYYCCHRVEKVIKQEKEVANRIRQIEKILEEI